MDDPKEKLAAKVFVRAAEVSETVDVANPFTPQVVGMYSCRGMDSGAISKTNQDRGCVVFPFGGQARQALFCCFDGHGRKGDAVSHMYGDLTCCFLPPIQCEHGVTQLSASIKMCDCQGHERDPDAPREAPQPRR